jgi:hypothetical protein
MNIRIKEISIGRVDLMRMGTTYISEFQKKREKCSSCSHGNYKCTNHLLYIYSYIKYLFLIPFTRNINFICYLLHISLNLALGCLITNMIARSTVSGDVAYIIKIWQIFKLSEKSEIFLIFETIRYK